MKVAQVNQFVLEIQWEFRIQHGNFESAISTLGTGDKGVHRECKFIYALLKYFKCVMRKLKKICKKLNLERSWKRTKIGGGEEGQVAG